MERLVPALLVILFILAMLSLMFFAWRARASRAARVTLPTELLAAGEELFTCSRVFYVATTLAEHPLERVAIQGLRYRGFADIEAYSGGLVMHIAGEKPMAIDMDRVLDVSARQLAIDKVVEPGGLIGIEWQSELGDLVSVFRIQDGETRAQLLGLVQHISPTITAEKIAEISRNKTIEEK